MMNKLILLITCCILAIRNGNCSVGIPQDDVFFRLTDKEYEKWVTDTDGDIRPWRGPEEIDQLWRAIDSDGTYFRLENKGTGNYLTAESDGNIHPYSGGEFDDSLWMIMDDDGTYFRLKNKERGTALFMDGGTNIVAYLDDFQIEHQYFRFDFDINWDTCNFVDYEFIDGDTNKFPVEPTVYKAEYINTGPITQSTDGVLELQKCESITVETEQESNWDVGVEASAGFSAFGADVSVTASFGMGGSNTKTNSKSEESCNTVSVGAPLCPSNYKCVREFIVSTIPETARKIKVTLDCGGVVLPWYGSLTVAGGAQVTFSDTFHPIGCFDYYSNIYSDRDDKLPFCSSCKTSNACNRCEIKSAASVLTDFGGDNVECISNFVCEEYCDGEVKGDEFNGFYCSNPDLTATGCKA